MMIYIETIKKSRDKLLELMCSAIFLDTNIQHSFIFLYNSNKYSENETLKRYYFTLSLRITNILE